MQSPPAGRQPLNPELYRALKRECGQVRLASDGLAMQATTYTDAVRGRVKTRVLSAGEYYRVCCAYCHDTKFRLWVNHQFAQPGPDGWPMLWLAHCYNEDCLSVGDRRKEFERQLFGFRNRNERAKGQVILPGIIEDPETRRREPPGAVCPLDKLEPGHPAVTYLQGRRFDPVFLARTYQIGYCLQESRPEFRTARQRLIIPIWMNGQYVGWQSRWAADEGWGSKYWTCPGLSKSRVLYNFDSARHWPFCVVVEGAPAVWRIGGPAVALLGKTMGAVQQRLIQETWYGKPVFIALDPDARREMEGILYDMSRAGLVHVIPVHIPEGYDPGDFDHPVIVQLLQQAAAAHGIPLPTW